MMLSIFPISENMTLIPEVLTLAGVMTGGYLGLAIWILIYFGALMITAGFRTGDSVVAAGFIGFITGTILWALELIKMDLLITGVIILIISIIFTKASRGGMPT